MCGGGSGVGVPRPRGGGDGGGFGDDVARGARGSAAARGGAGGSRTDGRRRARAATSRTSLATCRPSGWPERSKATTARREGASADARTRWNPRATRLEREVPGVPPRAFSFFSSPAQGTGREGTRGPSRPTHPRTTGPRRRRSAPPRGWGVVPTTERGAAAGRRDRFARRGGVAAAGAAARAAGAPAAPASVLAPLAGGRRMMADGRARAAARETGRGGTGGARGGGTRDPRGGAGRSRDPACARRARDRFTRGRLRSAWSACQPETRPGRRARVPTGEATTRRASVEGTDARKARERGRRAFDDRPEGDEDARAARKCARGDDADRHVRDPKRRVHGKVMRRICFIRRCRLGGGGAGDGRDCRFSNVRPKRGGASSPRFRRVLPLVQ